MSGLREAGDVARAIARTALGMDPGPMTLATSGSHYVYVSRSAVVKIIDAADHPRLDREIAIVGDLPAEIAPALLSAGRWTADTRDVRYACYRTEPGTTPGMGLPTTDEATALVLAEQAVQRLRRLHEWVPGVEAHRVLGQPLDHGGFTGRAAVQAALDDLSRLDTGRSLSPVVLDRLHVIADDAPDQVETTVPVHADCHWGNWLADGPTVTSLLDFEWARFGTPTDDWFFLARFSGAHQAAVLELIARMTDTPPDELRAACEVREVCYLVSDLHVELAERPTGDDVAELVRDLELVTNTRSWWPARR